MKNPFQDNSPEVKKTNAHLSDKRVLRSEDLFQGSREVLILHGEFYYRLQMTKAGKLILVK